MSKPLFATTMVNVGSNDDDGHREQDELLEFKGEGNGDGKYSNLHVLCMGHKSNCV